MKKLLAILLALMLILVNAAALAGDETEGTETDTETTYIPTEAFEFSPIYKSYYKELPSDESDGTVADAFPAETITFTYTADTTNPDGGENNVSVEAITIGSVSENMIKVSVPSLPKPGLYHFTVKEVEGTTQGVTYSGKDTELKISVIVVFDETDPTKLVVPEDGYGVTATGKDDDGNPIKVDEIANKYEVADLTITKAVSGNLGDKNRSFPVQVTFTATGKVLSDITITGEYKDKVETIAGDGWTGSKAVTIYVKDKSEIVFKKIPLNVTYTVVETDATEHLDNDATLDPNNPDAYLVGGEVENVKLTGNAEVNLTNEKSVEIDTGISMETVPYIMILVLALAGAAMLFVRKREEY